MKLKYPPILGFLHFLIIIWFIAFGFSSNLIINLLVLIFLLNLSSFIIFSLNFKKNLQHFIVFSAFSLISLVIYLIIISLLLYLLKNNLVQNTHVLDKYYAFASNLEKDYNNGSGVLQIIFVYIVFALAPSFLVLSQSVPKAKRRLIAKRRKRKI